MLDCSMEEQDKVGKVWVQYGVIEYVRIRCGRIV